MPPTIQITPRRYWLWGGIITTAVLSLMVIGILMVQYVTNGSAGLESSIFLLAPFVFVGALLLVGETSGASPATAETLIVMTIAISITLVSYFLFGAFLGFIWDKIRPRR